MKKSLLIIPAVILIVAVVLTSVVFTRQEQFDDDTDREDSTPVTIEDITDEEPANWPELFKQYGNLRGGNFNRSYMNSAYYFLWEDYYSGFVVIHKDTHTMENPCQDVFCTHLDENCILSMSACSFGNDEGNDTEKGTFANPHYETEADVCRVHDLVDGLCKNCGDDMPESQGLSYELVELEEGSAYAVNGLGTCKDTQVRIPAYYNDLPVVSLITLGESADVTNVMIGENVISMERGALFGLSSLKGLTVLAPSIALPSSCFESLSIESVILPEGLTEIPVGAFQGCGSLRRIHIPSTVTVIGDQAFSDCRLLREINFPDGLESIGHSAFKGIVSLREVTLPSSLKSVGNGAFSKCDNLKTVHYNGDIATWCMINFEMNGNPMINGADFYVRGEKVVDLRIPEGVNKPGDFSFQGCGSIESVVCPASMTELTLGMFMGCTNLTEAVFLGEIKTPGVMHFAGCTSLSDIYLNNAPEDFQAGPQFSTEAEVHYRGSWAMEDYYSLG